MTERLGNPNEAPEISMEQKLALISRARTLAPYKGQPVDRFGSFVTHFRHPDGEGFTSIYIPRPSGVEQEGKLFSDNVQIIKRIPEALDEATGVMHITSFGVHEGDYKSEYITDVRYFDMETGREVRPPQTPEKRKETAIADYKIRVQPITPRMLRVVNALLDTLNPDDTIELPEASST